MTPSPAPRWPPVTATASTVSWRSSSASCRSWLVLRRRRSAGVLMRSRRGVVEDWATRGDSDGGGNLTGWLRFNQPGRQDQTKNTAKSLTHLAFSAMLGGTCRSATAFCSIPSRGASCVMAPRANWKGYLKLSLVSCGIALFPATTTRDRVRFNIINRETGNRVRYDVVDADTGAEVPQEDRVKGYKVDSDSYVLLEEKELDEVALESTHTIEIEAFVEREEVDELYLDESY